MAIHSSKKTALLQLCNCMSSYDLKNLEDLADGKTFVDIISTSFPEFIQAEQPKAIGDSNEGDNLEEKKNKASETVKKKVSETEKKKASEAENMSAPEDAKLQIIEDIAFEVDVISSPMQVSPIKMETDTSGITVEIPHEANLECVKSVGVTEEKIVQNFKLVQKFIDEKYYIKSEDLISYSECMKADEFELSKVAFFLFSEVVKVYVIRNNNQLITLAHLDSRVQEDLEECFKLFILERENVSKSTVHNVLCNQTKYKYPSPSKRNSFITPRRSCPSKYRMTSPNEDVFTNSPLKSFFESPVFKKEDLLRKDKEIAKTRMTLYREECKTDNLESEISELRKKLLKRDDDLLKLKEKIKEMIESEKVKDEYIKQLDDEKEQYTKEFVAAANNYVRENSQLKATMSVYEKEIKDCMNGACKSGNILRDFMQLKKNNQEKEERIKRLEQKLKERGDELKESKDEIKMYKNEVIELKDRLQNITFDYMKNDSMYKEKLNDLKSNMKAEPSSPGSGEIIGRVIEDENKVLRLKLNEAELKIKELEEKLEKSEMVQLEKNCIPTHQNTTNLHMPDLVDISELTEAKNIENLQNENELPNTINMCDMSSSSDTISNHSFKVCDNSDNTEVIVSKNSFNGCNVSTNNEFATDNGCGSSSKTEVASNNSFTACDILSNSSQVALDNSFSSKSHWEEVPLTDPTVELYGTLWKNLNLENEDRALKDQESNGGSKSTIGSLTFNEFLNLLKISSVNISDRYDVSEIFTDKKSDSEYLSSILKVKKSRQNITKLMKDFRIFKELLSCLFIFVDSNCTIPNENFYDWVKSHLENGHRRMKEESEYERKIEDLTNLLKVKEESIERLNSDSLSLKAQLQESMLKLEEKRAYIAKLTYSYRRSKGMANYFKDEYEKCSKRVFALDQAVQEKNVLYKKLVEAEKEKKKISDLHRETSKKFRSYINEKDQEIQTLKVKIDNLQKINKFFEKNIEKLRAEKNAATLKVEELVSALREKDSAVYADQENFAILHPKSSSVSNYEKAVNKNRENAIIKNRENAIIKNHENAETINQENHRNATISNRRNSTISNHRYSVISNQRNAAITIDENDVISSRRNTMIRNHGDSGLENVKGLEKSYSLRNRKEQLNVSYVSESIRLDLNVTNASKDNFNESTLSGALHSKSGLFINHDEEDFFNQSSLEDIKKDANRVDELRRRNSLYPSHLRSAYPLEVDLPESANLYVKNQDTVDHLEKGDSVEQMTPNQSKKRKLSEVETDVRSDEVPQTPLMKFKRFVSKSPSMKKLLSRKNRPGPIKPKP